MKKESIINNNLHVYEGIWYFVVAESEDDARKVCAEGLGLEENNELCGNWWQVCDASRILHLVENEVSTEYVSKTCKEWAETGRRVLCENETEY